MEAVWQRLRDYGRIAWSMLSYGLLGALWLSVFLVFCTSMAPRLAYLVTPQPIAVDPPCSAPECDFAAFWPAGALARQHHFLQIYDVGRFLAFQRHALASAMQPLPFFYPPPTLLPTALISLVPFEPAYFLWTGGLLLLSVWVLRTAKRSWPVIIAGILSPAALHNTELGQLGTIGGALLVAGLCASRRTPVQAGSWFGVLVCKPQTGLLLPAILAGQRNWRALAAFAAMCVAWLLLTQVSLGTGAWAAYFKLGQGEAASVLNAPFDPLTYFGSGVSVFWMLRSLHVGLKAAGAVQGLCSLAAAALGFWLWRREGLSEVEKVAFSVFLSLLATPYGYTDDMVAYSLALALLAERRRWRIGMLDLLFFLWPCFCPSASIKTGVLLTPLIVLLAIARTWYRAGLPVPLLPLPVSVLPRAFVGAADGKK